MGETRNRYWRFGDVLHSARIRKGVTQADIARKLGCTVASVSYWECGLGLPRPDKARALRDMFGSNVATMWVDEKSRRGSPCEARLRRIRLMLSIEELAVLAGVGEREVRLLETLEDARAKVDAALRTAGQ